MPTASQAGITARTIVIILVAVIIFVAILFVMRSQEPSPLPTPPAPSVNLNDPALEVRRLQGPIIAITGNGFILDVPFILGEQISEDSPLRVREVIVNADTSIVRRTPKTAAMLTAEFVEYQEKRARGERAFPPSSYRETSISKSELKVGDNVQVTGHNAEDIKSVNPVTAGTVELE